MEVTVNIPNTLRNKYALLADNDKDDDDEHKNYEKSTEVENTKDETAGVESNGKSTGVKSESM